MKKAKSWLALPLAVCMFAVMIFSVAEAAETSDENPAEGRQEITIINTNHITWPVIGEMPLFFLFLPALSAESLKHHSSFPRLRMPPYLHS